MWSEVSGTGLLSELLFRQIKVPKNIGVAGIGNAEITSLVQPQLTTIDFRVEEIGIVAANSLINKINKVKLKKRIFDTGLELVKGGSTISQQNR